MKIGDLVKWNGDFAESLGRPDTGIVVDGPRDRDLARDIPGFYEVAWFDAGAAFWHAPSNLETLSENR